MQVQLDNPSNSMFIILLKNINWIVPTTFLVSWANFLFGDLMFLSLTADAKDAIGLLMALASFILLVLGSKYVLGTQRAKYEQAKLDAREAAHASYRENVDWLKANGFVKPGATKEEIDQALSLFNFNK